MSNSTGPTRVHVRMGDTEIEIEGEKAFVEAALPGLLALVQAAAPRSEELGKKTKTEKNPRKGQDSIAMSTQDIASLLSAKSGPDLITAAAAHLTFVGGKETFKRPELTEAMKSATAHYKKTYMNNLSAYLKTLSKTGVLLSPSADTFALSKTSQESLLKKLRTQR